ncbi:hypothetical protein I79_003404 [Cricetulus griseus]|uniref:Uncharacterized protein n=1 Tax=Cricetulus griseus TaxID=10029 RepID=G3GZV7_CRIGR|nr:hypothetical protein I79_003404 [Cricetulus griseus]
MALSIGTSTYSGQEYSHQRVLAGLHSAVYGGVAPLGFWAASPVFQGHCSPSLMWKWY